MNIVTLTSFEDELSLIKTADSAVGGLAKQVVKKLPTVAPKIPPVNQFSQLASKIMKSPSMTTGSIGKYGSAVKALGALGAGTSLLHGGLKEWDTRAAERRALAKLPAEQHSLAKQHVDEARMHRLKRMGVNAALAGGTGALAGHYGSKALKGFSETASKGLAEHLKPALEEALAKGHARGIQEGSQGSFWRAINPFKKK